MSIIGLDLAGLETRPTGFCLLSGMKAETTMLYTNDEILRKTEENKPRVIVIDAPLSCPQEGNHWMIDKVIISEKANENF